MGMVFISCSDSDNPIDAIDQSQDTAEVALSAEIDQVDGVLADLVIDAYELEENETADRSLGTHTNIPECVTLTVVAQQNYRQITLDFGDEGCLIQGHLLRGQIVFEYFRNPEAQEILITYNLVDFYFDAKSVLGSRTILRELYNSNGNPQFTHNLSITVIWPNGAQASREGTKIREWVEGFGSGIFSDNVFEVSGDWATTFVNGNTHTYNVISPLRREVICTYFVSGAVEVQRTNFGGIFDYGDGDCDNEALFTFNNGQAIEIILN